MSWRERTQQEIEDMEIGADLLYDEEAARLRDEEEAEAEARINEFNSDGALFIAR